MAGTLPHQFTARIEGDFVVFLIGMRINRPWRVGTWLPVARAMPAMLRELEARGPSAGLLGHSGPSMKVIVQYWRSFAHLEAYARDPDSRHWPAWVEFNRRMRNRRGDVGIWHETYLVPAGQYENIYSGMPRIGLAAFAEIEPIGRSTESARTRIAAE